MQKNKVLPCFLFGVVVVFGLPILRGEWTLALLCDGFSFAGILLLSYAGLEFLNAQNAFEGVFYIGARIKSLFLPFSNKGILDYSDYQQQRRKKTKNIDYSALIIGAGYLSLAIILLFFL
ncbi:MAG: DUF3899 domain-containing protein [Clostridia bacterium]|nr:DUF3899 domain-containing protein [Clostridia bacterium]